VGVWSGDVKLQNVKLTKAALNRFQLPVEILEGYLGTLVLSIPWSDIKNKPVKININGLYLLAGPRHQTQFDHAAHQEYEFKVKMDKLNKSSQASENDQNSTFMAQLLKRIVNNLQFSISNIHVRLEDKETSERPFSVGFSIQELSAYSANEEWKEAFISGDMRVVHKILKLASCSMYWNTKAASFSGKSPTEFMESMSSTILTENGGPLSWQYVVRPINGIGKVVISEVPEHGQAKYNTDLEFEDFSFSLDDEQYSSVFALLESMNLSWKATPYRALRPPQPSSPKTEPLVWFRFAATCILSDIHERRKKWSWKFFQERRDDRNIYVDAFIKVKCGNQTASDFAAVQQLEKKLSYSDLKLYRALADVKIKKMKKELINKADLEPAPVAAPGSPTSSWSSWIFGTSSTTTETEIDQNQLKELYETIEFDPEAVYQDIILSPEDLLVHVSWKLKNGSVTLKRNPHTTKEILVSLMYDGLSATMVQRPNSWFFVVDLINLSLLDKTTNGTVYPRVISKTLDDVTR
jgi:vacuolar protein sorting-associated protein 13A/C